MQLCLALRAALALAALSCSCRAAAAVVAAEPRRGIWAYFCYSDTASIAGSSPPGHYTRRCWEEQSVKAPAAVQGTLMMVKWRHVEPSSGVYDWSALDANISKAVALDLQLLIAIEICKADPKDEATPDWLYEAVPGVNFTHSPKGVVVPDNTTNPHRCPNYRDPRPSSAGSSRRWPRTWPGCRRRRSSWSWGCRPCSASPAMTGHGMGTRSIRSSGSPTRSGRPTHGRCHLSTAPPSRLSGCGCCSTLRTRALEGTT